MAIHTEHGRLAKDVELSHAQQRKLVRILKAKGYSDAGIAYIMRTSEVVVRFLLRP